MNDAPLAFTVATARQRNAWGGISAVYILAPGGDVRERALQCNLAGWRVLFNEAAARAGSLLAPRPREQTLYFNVYFCWAAETVLDASTKLVVRVRCGDMAAASFYYKCPVNGDVSYRYGDVEWPRYLSNEDENTVYPVTLAVAFSLCFTSTNDVPLADTDLRWNSLAAWVRVRDACSQNGRAHLSMSPEAVVELLRSPDLDGLKTLLQQVL